MDPRRRNYHETNPFFFAGLDATEGSCATACYHLNTQGCACVRNRALSEDAYSLLCAAYSVDGWINVGDTARLYALIKGQ